MITDIAYLESLPKETLIELLKMFAKTWLITDGVYFQAIEERLGVDEAVKIDIRMWERITLYQARKLKELLGLDERGPMAIARAQNYLISSLLDGFDIEFYENAPEKVVFACTRCSVQEARVRQGRGEFPCKPVGLIYHEKLIEALDPDVKLQCLACPPDPHPDDYWCKWELTM